MPRVAAEDNSRMSLRIRAEEKAILLRAATLQHTDLTDFVLRHARALPQEDHRISPAFCNCQSADSVRASRSGSESTSAKRKAAGRRAGVAAAVMSVTAWHEEPISKRHRIVSI